MPKAKTVSAEKAPKDIEETVSSPISGEVAAVVKPEEKQEKTVSKVKQTSFDVHNAGGTLVRTYTVEQHGKNAGDLAKEYAKKIDGSVK